MTHKDRRTTTYFFKNRADEDRIVWLEHNVIADRQLLGDVEPVEKGTNRYRFKLDLKKGQTLSLLGDRGVARRPSRRHSPCRRWPGTRRRGRATTTARRSGS